MEALERPKIRSHYHSQIVSMYPGHIHRIYYQLFRLGSDAERLPRP